MNSRNWLIEKTGGNMVAQVPRFIVRSEQSLNTAPLRASDSDWGWTIAEGLAL